MIKDSYECDGQIELTDYLAELEAKTEKCTECIYFKDFKCVRKSCYRLEKADGWNPLWYNIRGHVFGQWPTCQEWQPVETVIEGKEIFACAAEAKDKTFKWPKGTIRDVSDNTIAWRYSR